VARRHARASVFGRCCRRRVVGCGAGAGAGPSVCAAAGRRPPPGTGRDHRGAHQQAGADGAASDLRVGRQERRADRCISDAAGGGLVLHLTYRAEISLRTIGALLVGAVGAWCVARASQPVQVPALDLILPVGVALWIIGARWRRRAPGAAGRLDEGSAVITVAALIAAGIAPTQAKTFAEPLIFCAGSVTFPR
jgi:hypothetical protein